MINVIILIVDNNNSNNENNNSNQNLNVIIYNAEELLVTTEKAVLLGPFHLAGLFPDSK